MNTIPAKISVIIPSWNGAEILVPTLKALKETKDPHFEVVIVDHGKTNEQTRELLDSYSSEKRFRYVGVPEQLGFAGAVNYGVEISSGEIMAVICNDVLVDPDWLMPVRRRFLACSGKENPVLFSYVIRKLDGGVELGRTNIWMRSVYGASDAKEDCFFHPDGSCFFFQKSFYGKPFDADYFLYQEDVYLGWRAWMAGERVELVRESKVKNLDGGTTRRTPFLTSYFSERNRWWNYGIFLHRNTLLRLMPLLLTDFLLKLLFGKNRSAKIQAVVDILTDLPKLKEKRMRMQTRRKRTDQEILELLSFRYQQKGRLINGAFYLLARLSGFSPRI